jgi:hypothetical protein
MTAHDGPLSSSGLHSLTSSADGLKIDGTSLQQYGAAAAARPLQMAGSGPSNRFLKPLSTRAGGAADGQGNNVVADPTRRGALEMTVGHVGSISFEFFSILLAA